MQPYFEAGGITIYHGDCRDLLPEIEPGTVDLVLADPPYGKDEQTNYRERKRTSLALSNDFPAIIDDDQPFDPSHLLGFPRLILWGGNYYADKLPPAWGRLVWDKLDGLSSKREVGFNDNSDAEIAWTNVIDTVRIFRHRWQGLMKASERTQRRVWPTQKPVALAHWCLAAAKAAGLVVDPYCGSGYVGVACKERSLPCILIDRMEDACEIAARRIMATPEPLFPVEPAPTFAQVDAFDNTAP